MSGLRAPFWLSKDQKKVWYLSWTCVVVPFALFYAVPEEWQQWLIGLVSNEIFLQVLRAAFVAVILFFIVRRVRASRKTL